MSRCAANWDKCQLKYVLHLDSIGLNTEFAVLIVALMVSGGTDIEMLLRAFMFASCLANKKKTLDYLFNLYKYIQY